MLCNSALFCVTAPKTVLQEILAPQAKILGKFEHLFKVFFNKILANWDAKRQKFQPAAGPSMPAAHCPAVPYLTHQES